MRSSVHSTRELIENRLVCLIASLLATARLVVQGSAKIFGMHTN